MSVFPKDEWEMTQQKALKHELYIQISWLIDSYHS